MIKPKTIKGMLVQYIVIGMISICAVAFISMNAVSVYMKYEINDKGQKLIEVLSSSINASLEHPVSDLYTVKQLIEDEEITAGKSHILSNFLSNREYFVIIQIAEYTGRISHIVPFSEEYIDTDVSRQEYFRKALASDKPYWSSAHLSSQLDKPFVCLSIKTNLGILTAFLMPETILASIQELVDISKSYITVTDRNGVYIVHPDSSKVEQRVSDLSFNSLKSEYQGGIFETHENVDGEEMAVYVELIEPLGWMLKVHQSLQTALKPVKEIIIYLGALAFIITSLFSVVTARYLFRIGKSLENLIQSTIMVSEGKYNVKIDKTDFNDLNSLISSFNAMADSLSEREKQLMKMNRTLQHQVERITHAEQTFKTLIESTTGRYGEEYFDNLVKEMAGWFKVDTVLVSLFDYEKGVADAVSMYSNGKIIKGYTYPIAGSPCEKVAEEGFKYYKKDVAKLFPEDIDLVQMQSEGYLGTPIVSKEGDIKGVLCAISRKPMTLPEWGKDLVEIVASKAQAELERMEADHSIRKSLEEKEIMLKEIHHRVKNNMQVVIGLLSLQMEGKPPEVTQLLTESVNRIYVMALLHQKLYQSESMLNVELSGYIESLVQNIIETSNISLDLKINIDVDEIKLELDHIIPIGLIINELVSNAMKHAFGHISNPEITVCLKSSGKTVILTVSDNGSGFPEDYTVTSTETLGMSLVESLAMSMNGQMEIDTQEKGALIKITFDDL